MVAGALGLSACAAPPKPPPPPPPTIANVTVDVRPNANPDARGRPSPVVVRFFELKSLAVFNSADFFALFNRDREMLAADLVAREELQLSPGEKRTFERKLAPDTAYLGVVAGFRDLERAVWRAAVPIAPNKTQSVTITLEGSNVRMDAPT
jgi:type VI secretion system protein VasD